MILFNKWKPISTLWSCQCIKENYITAAFGIVIYDNQVLLNNANDVSMRHLRRLHFKYVDSFGKTIDLHGADSSFSLTFFES